MTRAGDVRILLLVAATLLTAVSCGSSPVGLPAASSVSFPSLSPVTTIDAALPTDEISTTSSLEPATSSNAVDSSTTIEEVTSSLPATGEWVNATEGLVGLVSECGNLSLVATRPDQDMLIAGVARQGLWASTDGVDTWSPLGTAGGSDRITNRASDIVFDPDNPTTFWESGTYNVGGVYRTDDNGASFRQLGDVTHVEGVAVDFTDPARNTLIATIHESNEVFLSTDVGQTWTDMTAFLPDDIGWASAAVVLDDHTFLLGTSKAGGSGVLRSTDAGKTWTTAYDAGVLGRPLRASNGALYWTLERINGMIVSYDDGETWDLITPTTEVLPNFATILELIDGSLASIWNDRVVVSTNQGLSWTPIGPEIPVAPSGIVYSPFRRAFYVWHFDCDFSTDDPILENSIMRLDFDPTAV